MPQVRSLPAKKPRHPTHHPKQRRPRHHGFVLELLGEHSPTLSGSTTTEHEMLFWVGLFYRLHQRRKRLIPVHLKTLDRPIAKADGSPVTSGDGQPLLMRCVREVAVRERRGHLTWEVIEYEVGIPGFRSRPCQSLDEAMVRFESSPEPVHLS